MESAISEGLPFLPSLNISAAACALPTCAKPSTPRSKDAITGEWDSGKNQACRRQAYQARLVEKSTGKPDAPSSNLKPTIPVPAASPPVQVCRSASQCGGVGAVASQDGDMERGGASWVSLATGRRSSPRQEHREGRFRKRHCDRTQKSQPSKTTLPHGELLHDPAQCRAARNHPRRGVKMKSADTCMTTEA
jgi:hypothetical protein